MRVLFLGEIVGKAGHFTIKTSLKSFAEQHQVDFAAANANGATGGFGLGKNHSIVLKKRGIDVLTGGECIYYKKDIVDFLPRTPWVLRPANLPYGAPGRGWGVYDTPAGPLGVICLLGQAGYSRTHGDNPYAALGDIVRKVRERAAAVILNFHATATAEKQAMAHHADGLVSAVIGTGTRCLTDDAEIQSGGTAAITDAGRTGSRASIYGMDSETELRILKRRVPERSKDGWGDLRMQGVLLDITKEGKAASITIVDRPSADPDTAAAAAGTGRS